MIRLRDWILETTAASRGPTTPTIPLGPGLPHPDPTLGASAAGLQHPSSTPSSASLAPSRPAAPGPQPSGRALACGRQGERGGVLTSSCAHHSRSLFMYRVRSAAWFLQAHENCGWPGSVPWGGPLASHPEGGSPAFLWSCHHWGAMAAFSCTLFQPVRVGQWGGALGSLPEVSSLGFSREGE